LKNTSIYIIDPKEDPTKIIRLIHHSIKVLIMKYVGGQLILDLLCGITNIINVSMLQKMAASIATDGYAGTGGIIRFAMAPTGPEGTRLITSIIDLPF
jgi:hypothetical protein